MIMTSKSPSLLAQRLRFRLLDLSKSRLLSRFPLQPMNMLPRLSHRILRHKQRAIRLSLRGLSLAQRLRRSRDAWVVRAAGEHA